MAQVLNVARLTLAIKTEVEFEELFYLFIILFVALCRSLCKKHAHETRERVFAPFFGGAEKKNAATRFVVSSVNEGKFRTSFRLKRKL